MSKLKTSLQKVGMMLVVVFVFAGTACKTSSVQKKVPFTIDEKIYFYWVGGQKGTRGTTIRITGVSQTLNISFSKIYFQNKEYEVVPQFSGNDFVLEATLSEFIPPDKVMSGNPLDEYGNVPPKTGQSIPFELNEDEAVVKYAVSGSDSYLKVTGIKQLETQYRP
jgi:hypothetical protein